MRVAGTILERVRVRLERVRVRLERVRVWKKRVRVWKGYFGRPEEIPED